MKKASLLALLALPVLVWIVLRSGSPSPDVEELSPGGPGGALTPGPTIPSDSPLVAPDDAPSGPSGAVGGRVGLADPSPGNRDVEGTVADPSPSAAEVRGPFLMGSVVDANGMPIVGAEVQVTARDGGGQGISLGFGSKKPLAERAQTDRAGTFRVSRGDHGRAAVTVDVRARGYLPIAESRSPGSESGDADLGALVLELGVVLGGRVTDSRGEPVEGAQVLRTTRDGEALVDGIFALAANMEGRGPEKATTDSEGRFELPGEAAGDYVVIFEHEDYPRGRLEGRTPPAGQSDLSLELVFRPSVRIEGRIVGFPTGRKHIIVQAEVQSSAGEEGEAAPLTFFDEISGGAGPTTNVASDGTFVFRGLPAEASLKFQAFAKSGVFGRIPASDAHIVEARVGTLELQWDAGARLTFEVFDADSGTPIDGDVEVRHLWQGRGTSIMPPSVQKADIAGHRVELLELRPESSPGLLDLVVSADGFLDHREKGVVIQAGSETELAPIRLRRAPKLRVRVFDDASGEPIRRARVTLRPEVVDQPGAGPRDRDVPFETALVSRSVSGKTEADGWCELSVPTGSAGELEVRKSGFVDYRRTNFPMPTSTGGEEIVRLGRGAELEVTVVDGGGRPKEGMQVQRRVGEDGESESRGTNSRGVALFKDLAPGEHEFRAIRRATGSVRVSVNGSGGEDESGWVRASVASGERESLTIEVLSDAHVIGRVSTGGIPLVGVPVVFLNGSEPSEQDQFLTRMSDGFAAMVPGASVRARTDDEGRFRLGPIPVGEHRLHVKPSEGAPAHIEVFRFLEGENPVDLDIPGGAAEGRVVGPGGRGVPGARVRIEAEGDASLTGRMAAALELFGANTGGVRTDYDGSFAVAGVPGGISLVARVDAPGYVPGSSVAFSVPVGGSLKGVLVVLEPGGSIEVSIEGEWGPLTAIEASRVDAEPVDERHVIARQGRAVFEGLRPGVWRVSAQRNDDSDSGTAAESDGTVEVRAGERSRVALQR